MPEATDCIPTSETPGKRLGKMPAKASEKTLLFARYLRAVKLPAESDFWKHRAAFPPRSYGNRDNGCCTRASQANAATRMERIETRRTVHLTDEEVLRVYYAMTERLYGGGDTGAYETDALDEWRNPERTFKDAKGRPLCIDAYTRVNQLDADEVKAAIHLSGTKGVKLCLNLPAAFSRVNPPDVWDIPSGPLTGEWVPGSWGGHSLFADAYGRDGIRLVQTWYDSGQDEQILSWRALAAYCDEMYSVIDSVDVWRRRAGKSFAVAKLVEDVNRVSGLPPASLA